MEGGNMDADSQKATRYRVRAEEIRTIADGMKEPQTRAILMGIERDYLRMAEALSVKPKAP